MPVHSVERKLAAIFAADIAGYSRLMARDEVGRTQRIGRSRLTANPGGHCHRKLSIIWRKASTLSTPSGVDRLTIASFVDPGT